MGRGWPLGGLARCTAGAVPQTPPSLSSPTKKGPKYFSLWLVENFGASPGAA